MKTWKVLFKKRFLTALLMLLFFALPLHGSDVKPRNIILVGWDAAPRDHIKRLMSEGRLPHLKKLVSKGTIVAIDNIRQTDTKAGWAQILTGYEPEITGVFRCSRYVPIPEGYTVFERLEKYFGADRFITVAVIGKKQHMEYDPPQYLLWGKRKEYVIKKRDRKCSFVPGKPYYYTKQNVDIFINGLGENKEVGEMTLKLLRKYQRSPFFFFVHFWEPDTSGHLFGEDSKEFDDAIISDDDWLGKIVEELKNLYLYDKTLIYVTSDHGFDKEDYGHRDAPYVFLATNDAGVIRRGELTDIAATILERFGIDISTIEPKLDGHPLTKKYAKPMW